MVREKEENVMVRGRERERGGLDKHMCIYNDPYILMIRDYVIITPTSGPISPSQSPSISRSPSTVSQFLAGISPSLTIPFLATLSPAISSSLPLTIPLSRYPLSRYLFLSPSHHPSFSLPSLSLSLPLSLSPSLFLATLSLAISSSLPLTIPTFHHHFLSTPHTLSQVYCYSNSS